MELISNQPIQTLYHLSLTSTAAEGLNTNDIKLTVPYDHNGNKSHSQNYETVTTGEGQLLSQKVSATDSKAGTNKDKQDATPSKSKEIKDISDVNLEKSSILIIKHELPDPGNTGQELRPEADIALIPSNLNLSISRRIEHSQVTNTNRDPVTSYRDQVASYRDQVVSYREPGVSYREQVVSYREPLPLQPLNAEVQNTSHQAIVGDSSYHNTTNFEHYNAARTGYGTQSLKINGETYSKPVLYASANPYINPKRSEDILLLQTVRTQVNEVEPEEEQEQEQEKKGESNYDNPDYYRDMSIDSEPIINNKDNRQVRETPGRQIIPPLDTHTRQVNSNLNTNRIKNADENMIQQHEGDRNSVPLIKMTVIKSRLPNTEEQKDVPETNIYNRQSGTIKQNQGDNNSVGPSTMMKSKSSNSGEQKKFMPDANAFPYKYFMGGNPAEIIRNEEIYHNANFLQSEKYTKHEIEDIINPCLEAYGIDDEVKECLRKKKEVLQSRAYKLLTGFRGDQQADEMHKANTKLCFSLKHDNKLKEYERVKERLKYAGATLSEDYFVPRFNPQANLPQAERPVQDPIQSPIQSPIQAMQINGERPAITKIFKSSVNILLKRCLFELEKRILQYKALSIHMTNNIIPYLEEPEKSETKNRVKIELEDKIIEAEKLKSLPMSNSGKRLVNFLKEGMKELDPQILHGKSMGQKVKEILLTIEMIDQSIKAEEIVLRMVEKDKDTILQSGRMIAEINDTIAKYRDYAQKLKDLLMDTKSEWIFVPRTKTKPIYRSIIYQGVNINPNTMVIQLQKIESKAKRAYFVQWKVDGASAATSNKVVRCDKKTLRFNDTREVVFSETEMSTIHNKTLRLELMSSSASGCLQSAFTKKHGSTVISLQDFETKHIINGTAQFPADTSLTYALKIAPHVKEFELRAIDSFTIFPKFVLDIDKEHPSFDPPLSISGSIFLARPGHDALASINPIEIPEGFTLEEILYPDNPQTINCYKVLEDMLKRLQEAELKMRNDPRNWEYELIKEKYNDVSKKAEIVHQKIQSGDLDAYNYMDILEREIQRDRKLEIFYKERKEEKRLAFIMRTIKLMEGELGEIMRIFEEES